MSAKALVVDLNQLVAGQWYVHVKGVRFEKFYTKFTPLRAVLHEACRHPCLSVLGVSPESAVITEFDLFTKEVSLEIQK